MNNKRVNKTTITSNCRYIFKFIYLISYPDLKIFINPEFFNFEIKSISTRTENKKVGSRKKSLGIKN